MIKLLHCADFHLDTPFTAKDSRSAQARRQMLRNTFIRCIDIALERKVDFLLIAGDLFDRNFITDETAKLILSQFARLEGITKIILTPGNHDPYQPDSIYQKTEFPSNVSLFTSDKLTHFDFPECNTRIYGYAFLDRNLATFPLAHFTPDESDATRIDLLCAHTEYDSPASKKAPITAHDLENSHFDYAAFGHIHKYSGMHEIGQTHYCYCGSADGLDFGECGPKYFIYAELSKAGGKTRFLYEAISSSPRHYEILPIDISGAQHNLDAVEAIRAGLLQNGYDENTAVRILLRGNVGEKFYFSEAELLPYFEQLLHLEIRNETNPFFDCKELEADIGIRGALYRQLKEKLNSEDPEDRAIAQSALQYGLCALSGNEFPMDLPEGEIPPDAL